MSEANWSTEIYLGKQKDKNWTGIVMIMGWIQGI